MGYLARFYFTGVMLLLLSGCAAQGGVKQRYFWPIGGLEPKIEYVKFYETDREVKLPESAFAQAVLGVEDAKPLFSSPHGIGSRGDDVFAVTDPGLNNVVVLDLQNGAIRRLKNIEGDNYFFQLPMAVTYRPDSGGYVSDTGTNSIFRFNANEVVVQEIGKDDDLNRPNGMVYDPASQRLFVADTLNHQIAVFSEEGKLLQRIGKRGEGEGEFNFPLDIALAPTGELVVLDALNARVQVLRPDGSFLRMFGERGTAAGSFTMPKGVAVDGSGNVYVTDSRAHRFVVFSMQGDYLLSVGARSFVENGEVHPGGFGFPKGIAADLDGKILIVDSFNRMVHRYQYLDANYLEKNPIRPEEIYLPPDFK